MGNVLHSTRISFRPDLLVLVVSISLLCSAMAQAASAQAMATLYREYSPATAQHLSTTVYNEAPGSSLVESMLGRIYTCQSSGNSLRQLYRCVWSNGTKHFTSIDPQCENVPGASVDLPLGWIDPARAANEIPLYRLFNAKRGDFMDSTNPTEGASQGYELQGPLGYVQAVAPAPTTPISWVAYKSTIEAQCITASTPLNPGTDITQNLQTIINCMAGKGGGKILLPGGNFHISLPIQLQSRVWIVGSPTTVLVTDSGKGLETPGAAIFYSKGVMLEGASLQQLTLNGQATPQAIFLFLEDARFNLFDRLTVNGLSQGTLYFAKPQGGANPAIAYNWNNFANIFSNLTMDSGKYGLVLWGNQDPASAVPKPQSAVTLNSYRNISLSSISGIGIQAVSWTDSENFDTVKILLNNANAAGISFRSSDQFPNLFLDGNSYQFAHTAIGTTPSFVAGPSKPDSIRFSSITPFTGGYSFLGLTLGGNVQFNGTSPKSYFIASNFTAPPASGQCNILEDAIVPQNVIQIGPPASGAASAAIQAKINALRDAGGGHLILGSGLYLIDQSIQLANNVQIEGNGFGTILRPTSGSMAGIFTNSQRLTGASLKNFTVDGTMQPALWFARILNPTGVYVANVLGLHLNSGGALMIDTTRPSTGNCFENIIFDEINSGVAINPDQVANSANSLTMSEFRALKFMQANQLGVGILRNAANDVFSDLVIWNGQANATSIMVGSPWPNSGESATAAGQSVASQTIYNLTETMEGGLGAHSYGAPPPTSNPSSSRGVWFSNTSGHALLGVFYTDWSWKNPIFAVNSDNLTVMNTVSEALRGSTDWQYAYDFPMSGFYEYKCTTKCTHPLNGLITSKGISNLGDAGLVYMP